MNIKQKLTTLFLLVILGSVLEACSQRELVGPKQAFQPDELAELSENNARLVFYRSKNDKKRDVVIPTITIDKRVVGALNTNQYIVSDVCGGEGEFDLRQRREGAQPLHVEYQAAPQETVYFNVQALSENQFQVTQVTEKQALKDLKKVKYTSHLANRREKACAPIMVAEETPKAPKESELLDVSSLAVDVLFRFDSAALVRKVMPNTKDALQALDNLVETLSQEGVKVDKVRVVGHTDRLGAPMYNQALSERRAKAVANYFTAKGLKQDIEVLGTGDKQPITEHCEGSRATVELIECLQPDRRVNVELWSAN